MQRKRPCSICGRWFYPDSRVGDRQQACSDPACQVERRKKTQAKWRTANPEYATAQRLSERQAKRAELPPTLPNSPEETPPARSRMPAPLDRLPWDDAQDQFGPKATDFIMEFGRLLVRASQDQKDQRRVQVTDSS